MPSPPRWFKGDDGRFHLWYELTLTNAFPVSVTVRSIEVRTGGRRVIGTLSGAELEAAMSLLASDGLPSIYRRLELTGRVPSLDDLGRAFMDGTPVPIDPADAGKYRNSGLTGLEVVTFPGG